MIWEPVTSSITATASNVNISGTSMQGIDDAIHTAIMNYHNKALKTDELDKHIDELEEDIDYLDDTTQTLKAQNAMLKIDLSAALGKISTLENEVKSAQVQIMELQKQIVILRSDFHTHELKESQD